MLQLLTKRFALRESKGFTLIELLVVIAIIGILSSIVLVSMGGARKTARDSVRKADMRQIISAEELYYNTNDIYTKSAAYPTAILPGMTKTPIDPTNSGSYIYKWIDNSAGDGTKFCAYATLEEKGTCATTAYYTASHAGNFTVCTAPTTVDTCQ